MEALHEVRESHKRPAEELPPCDKMPRESASAKTKKRVRLTKHEEEEIRKYFTSEIASKVKKKPILFSCEEFLHDHPYCR